MNILGLKGSPRRNSNSGILLSTFLSEAEKNGANTTTLDIPKMNINPCRGCGHCEKHGFCVMRDDDMSKTVYPLLRQADLVIVSTPIYFYSATAQIKAAIDRSQTLWSRIYRFKLSDPGAKTRKGFLLAVGATKGQNLFDGIKLTAKYFYDAIGAEGTGSLTYRRIEHAGEIEDHPDILEEVREAAHNLTASFLKRKKIVFACRENACRSQMAGAFAKYLYGDKVDVQTCGSEPAKEINPLMMDVMAEKGLDMAFITPASMETILRKSTPDMIITMGCGEACPFVPGAVRIDWDLPDPAGKPIEFMRDIREKIEAHVKALLNDM